MFPSENERILTASIVAFLLGIAVGLFAMILDITDEMDIENYLFAASLCLIISGWVVKYRLDRKNEIARTSLGYRLDMLRTFIDLSAAMERLISAKKACSPNIDELRSAVDILIEDCQIKALIYGSEEQVAETQKLTVLRNARNDIGVVTIARSLADSSRAELRAELAISNMQQGRSRLDCKKAV